MLEDIDNWLEPFRLRAWDAAYRREETNTRGAVESARQAFELSSFSDDECRAIELAIFFMGMQADESFLVDPEDRPRLLLDSIARVSLQQEGPLARVMQARILLTLRCWAARFGISPLSAGEVEAYYNLVPYDDLEHHNWTFLSFWAFQERNAFYLSLAYKQFLTKPFDFMIDFSRQRLKVMLQLVEGRAQPKEIERLIEVLPHLLHVAWMREHIVPASIDAGIWSLELNSRLVGREQSLIDAGPKPPPREKRAVSYKVNL